MMRINNPAQKDSPLQRAKVSSIGFLRTFGLIDGIIILGLLVACVFFFPEITSITSLNVAIYRDNTLIAKYPLHTNREITVEGSRGTFVITIKNREVFVSHADCPNHICQKTGSIHLPHNQIICAPNHLLLTISGNKDAPIDAISR